jgi:phenylacetate-coenzyme A ligase PaaK-like adenylate-forming protein
VTKLKTQESIFNFIRHCAYDGVSEWKAYFKKRTIDPDTIKLIKDNLLRLPFEIEKHQL